MTLRDRYVVRQEPEGVSERKVGLVAVIAIAIAIGAVGVAWWLLPDTHLGRHPADTEPVGEEVGEVYVTRIRRTAIGLQQQEEARKKLLEYGWVDRDEGIARIPIERAMDIVVESSGHDPEVPP